MMKMKQQLQLQQKQQQLKVLMGELKDGSGRKKS